MARAWGKAATVAAMAMAMSPLASGVIAAVPADVAARLERDLTPVGAERAGNASGTIPPWTGGLVDGRRPDALFATERPVIVVTADNVARYADRLPEGARALLHRFADYRILVYPSHRTAALPASVYAAIARNAVRAGAAPEGIAYGVQGAVGGVPFPIPQDGFQIMWNHLLAFWGAAREVHVQTWVANGHGPVDLVSSYREVTDFPYYAAGATPDSFGRYYFKTSRLSDGPAGKEDEGYVAWQPIDSARDKFVAWRYLPGEHRVRKAPSLSYDTPNADSSGYEALDEYYLFFGGLDRYVMRSLGKREMFVPYNNNAFYQRPPAEVMGPRHANQDVLRYELHRVWVVEATLAPGQHHVAPRRRFYVDEDTWLVVCADSWDEQGRLWKYGHGTMYVMPDVPAVVTGGQFVYDLIQGGYVYDFGFNQSGYRVTPPHGDAAFTATALAAEAVR